MKVNNVLWYTSMPIAMMFQKKVCPKCGEPLTKIKASEVVRVGSPAAAKYPIRPHMVGNVKVVWTELHCLGCCKTYTYDELDYIRQEKRDKEKQRKRLEKRRQKLEKRNK